ncbi:MAG: hypothetical protein AABM67_05895 [Acidobacteriota bacterium]
MGKRFWPAAALALALALGVAVVRYGVQSAAAFSADNRVAAEVNYPEQVVAENGFSIEIIVDGRPVPEYAARGRRYVEAFENAEYELRIHNPFGTRVAVALAVDGLNTIDARHTSAWDAHKWVIQPYGTISVRGWQMSSENARRFYFTTERDSYGAKLGQTANLGVISAVFFRERKPITIMPVVPRPQSKDDRSPKSPQAGTTDSYPSRSENRSAEKSGVDRSYPPPDDESAATGIGRSVRNDVQWVKMDLESRPAGEVTIRYEYRASLVRLGIIPRDYRRPEVLDRRERAKGFEPKYCPEP